MGRTIDPLQSSAAMRQSIWTVKTSRCC